MRVHEIRINLWEYWDMELDEMIEELGKEKPE